MSYGDFVDCQCFAGGFTLGAVQAGWELVGKRENLGGFGTPALEVNRHLLGGRWDAQATKPEEWEPVDVPLVLGNPPCSGFSPMTNKDFRGVDSPINQCMRDLITYASLCRPETVVMESVCQAFTTGRPLMTRLRELMEQLTGRQWSQTHVLQDVLSLGGCAVRKRYFMVLHQAPFGVGVEPLTRVPCLNDAIADLEPLDAGTWEAQRYQAPAGWWASRLLSPSGVVDGHATHATVGVTRVKEMLEVDSWAPRESLDKALARWWVEHGDLPAAWHGHVSEAKLRAKAPDFSFGFNQPVRWDGDRPSRVVTGGALLNAIHPRLPRPLTHRECLRILGFPDDWRVVDLAGTSGVHQFWGKGVSVAAGRWVAHWAGESMSGRPGDWPREQVGEREWVTDVSKVGRALVGRDKRPLYLSEADQSAA